MADEREKNCKLTHQISMYFLCKKITILMVFICVWAYTLNRADNSLTTCTCLFNLIAHVAKQPRDIIKLYMHMDIRVHAHVL